MSITKTESVWMVARLNYNEPWLHFLIKSLKPFVDSLSRAGIVERYYFERSFDGGANISLFFRSNPETIQKIIIPNLEDHFKAYMLDKPSPEKAKIGLFPNNSVVVLPYEPAAAAWGGSVGLPIAERHFQSSSDSVLAFMAEKVQIWTPDEVLTTAMHLHLGFVDAMGMDTEEATRFFEYALLYHAEEDFRLQYFEEFFDNQRQPLLDYHADMWESLKSKTEFHETTYNAWLEQCFYTIQDLRRTFKQRVLKVEAKFSALWTLYAQLMRKTNNRLGIFGRDESLIFYLMMRSLEKIETETKS